MKILVTGANGFLGSHIAESLLKKGYPVVCLVRKESNKRWLSEIIDKVEVRYSDFLYPETLKNNFDDIDVVIHAAGLTNTFDWHNYYLVNFLGTKNILKACLEAGKISKFIYISSHTASGPSPTDDVKHENSPTKPVSHLGKSKLLAEEEAMKYISNFNVVILRPTVIYGPRDFNLLPLFKFAKKGFFVRFGDLNRIVNLCYIDDFVDGVLKVLDAKLCSGELYYIGGNNEFFYEIKDTLSKVVNKKLKDVLIPRYLVTITALFYEIIGRLTKTNYALNRDRVLDLLQQNWGITCEKAKRDLNYIPKTALLTGLEKTMLWYQKNNLL